MIQIGERAGIITPSNQSSVIDAFGAAGPNPRLEQQLNAFECDVTELFVMVTLLAANPRPVAGSVLAHEVLRDRKVICDRMDHLESQGLCWRTAHGFSRSEAEIGLTELGRDFAMYFIYRTLTGII